MNSQIHDTDGLPSASTLDSITLGQLKAMVGPLPKPKQSFFDYVYDDEDTVMNEIDEFYSYVEMPQVEENVKAWEGSFISDWTKAPVSQRKAHVELLLESLEHRDAEVRFTNARRLFYVLQGTFVETTSPEHQLHWIFENCKVVRSVNGVSSIVEAMKIASSKHDMLCGLSDLDASHFNISAQEKSDLTDEVVTEIYIYLGMLYHLIEIFKGHDDFADELMSLDPPLPVYLFNVIAGLRDKGVRTYPIKKLLLVLWKTLLTCCGGIRELTRVKKLSRELAGLPPATETVDYIKSSPLDIETFRQETAVKYPTFTPPQQPIFQPVPIVPEPQKISKPVNPPLYSSKLAQAYSPIPVRHHYHHDDDTNIGLHGIPHHHFQPPQQHQQYRPIPQTATPAPSPPPSPKPKKQQYQTDQNRPFLFPFPKGQFGRDARFVPFAINEADQLFNKHMYVSLSLWQMWRTREDCIAAESGLEHMPGDDEFQSSTFTANDPEVAEPLPDIALLGVKIEESMKILETSDSNAEKRKARERKEDLMRLKRVEQIYSAILPGISGWVGVLLKLLLATVSPDRMQGPQSSTSSVFPPGVASPQEQPPAPSPTLDEIDVTRHREVTSKAVSAILLLILKWFKVSHVMKFHQLGQHLLDTNCLLLILKIFGLQEVATSVVSKADAPDHNFFRYCLLNFSRDLHPVRPEDNQPRPSRYTQNKTTILPNGEKHEEEVEYVSEYSWRNFFSAINFAKIMQKLSKGRSHRIWMLVQYKSSAILKRVLRVNHPMLQLHVLKLIKSQVPFCGRKWRQSNMKVITSIYLNCRPDLRDEWLTGSEVDDATDAQAQELALRHLVKFYNNKRYGPAAASSQHGPLHRKSGSVSHHIEGLPPGPELANIIRPLGTPNTVDSDVFPPARAQAPDTSIFLPYITEDIAFEEEYEEYLSDMGWSESESIMTDGPLFPGGTSAWHRLPAFASEMVDGISDSESIVSIGDLGDARLDTGRDDDRDGVDENLNNWEHMSPKTMAALPKSPAGTRRSSSGSGLRPVLPFGLDDGSAIDPDEDEDLAVGPVPKDESNPFASGAGVDEVEYAYGQVEFPLS
ncbi:Protein FAM40A [Termitomyces sp. J132]|nr:Protein FAM40A [Termitomyces sp. J132]